MMSRGQFRRVEPHTSKRYRDRWPIEWPSAKFGFTPGSAIVSAAAFDGEQARVAGGFPGSLAARSGGSLHGWTRLRVEHVERYDDAWWPRCLGGMVRAIQPHSDRIEQLDFRAVEVRRLVPA
jgi:hypothetical protein